MVYNMSRIFTRFPDFQTKVADALKSDGKCTISFRLSGSMGHRWDTLPLVYRSIVWNWALDAGYAVCNTSTARRRLVTILP